MTKPTNLRGSALYQEARERFERAATQLAAAQAEYHQATGALLFAQRLQLRDDTTAALLSVQISLEQRLEALEGRLTPGPSTT